jgi:hypothetical protein
MEIIPVLLIARQKFLQYFKWYFKFFQDISEFVFIYSTISCRTLDKKQWLRGSKYVGNELCLHIQSQIEAIFDGFHCILLLWTAPIVCTQNVRPIKQTFYNLIFETSFRSMNEKVTFHLSLFTPQEHDIEWCIPKGRNDLKAVKVSFSSS